jgi:hypothetical protein
MTAPYPVTVLLAAPPGITSRSLVTLLGTIVQREDVRYVASLPDLLEELGHVQAGILLLDEDLLGDESARMDNLKAFMSTCRTLQPSLVVCLMIVSLYKREQVLALGAEPMLKALLETELQRLPNRYYPPLHG